MKKLIIYALSSLILFMNIGYCEDLPEYTVDEMTPEFMESFEKGELQAILRFDEGDTIPFTLSIEGDVLALAEDSPRFPIQVKQRVYIKIENKDFFFSLDKETWKSFEKQFGGKLGTSVGYSDEEGPFGGIYLKLLVK